jgi:hypothetical protein
MSSNTYREIFNKNLKCILLTKMVNKRFIKEIKIKEKNKGHNFKLLFEININAESMES